MTDFGLPPRRALPPDVRERIRAAVQEEMRPARRSGRWVFVAAAAVVVLALGAVSVTQLIKPTQQSAVGGAPASGIDRCWSAVETAGKTSSVPARAEWNVVYTEAKGDDSVIAVTAAGKPLFCETTLTSVTVSDPQAQPRYAADGKTALLLYTATGLAAAITDPSTPNMDFYVDDLGATMQKVAPTGQFSGFTALDPAKTQLSAWARGNDIDSRTGIAYLGARMVLPPPPAPLLTLADRGADRKSAAGAALGECLAKAPEKLTNADAYAPGVLLQDGRYQVVLGKVGLNAVACTSQPDPSKPENTLYRLYSNTFVGQSVPVKRLSVQPIGTGDPPLAFVGIVPDDTAKLTADVGIGSPVYADVAGGTFGMWLPPGAKPPAGDGMAWVMSENAAGTPSFNGWIPFA